MFLFDFNRAPIKVLPKREGGVTPLKRFSIPGVPNLPFRIVGPKKVSPPVTPSGPNGEPMEPAKKGMPKPPSPKNPGK